MQDGPNRSRDEGFLPDALIVWAIALVASQQLERDPAKLNLNGIAIALGHPLGRSSRAPW